ncbi:MAG: nucleoid-associated protein [Sphingobacteriales bacterium]|nr:nucleoid-associated protein [Sphingobacteriales bacterium]
MLAVSRYIIHEVHKEFKVIGATVEPSLQVPVIDDFAKKLIEETHKSFGMSTSLKNTKFEDGHSTPFHTGLTNYLDLETEDDFYSYTINSLNDLKERIENEQFATGGYYLFADYHFDARRYVSAILLRKKSGINFQKVNNVFRPVEGETLNIEKIAMGFRLNYGIFISDDPDKNYVALITTQQDKLSGYFRKWVQAAGIISNDKNTSALVKIINSIDIPVDENGASKYPSREEMKKAFYDVVEQSPGKSVNLMQLSQYFYGEAQEQYISEYAQQNSITIDTEFKRSSTVLKKLITIRAKTPGIELNVDYDKLNANEVDVQDNIVIIRSQAIVDQINQQRNEQ